MEKLRKFIFGADVFLLISAVLATAGVLYEGFTLKWYSIVGIFVMCMDWSFLAVTVLHLIADKKDRHILIHIFSMLICIAAIIIKVSGSGYPPITLVLWYLYIVFVYGAGIILKIFGKRMPE